MSTSQDRLPRLLALVPYLIARPGIPVDEAAADFGVSAKQLRKDLELLWMCGLPGYGPGDLIDLSFEGDTISVNFDAGMNRPLRLTGAEATALLVALRTLLEAPGVADADAVRRAVAKIEAAAGQAQPAGVAVGLGVREGKNTAKARLIVQSALKARHALRMTYYTASKDEINDRTVDPMRMLHRRGPQLPGGVVPPRRGGAAVPARPDRRRHRARRAGRAAALRRADRHHGGPVPGAAGPGRGPARA